MPNYLESWVTRTCHQRSESSDAWCWRFFEPSIKFTRRRGAVEPHHPIHWGVSFRRRHGTRILIARYLTNHRNLQNRHSDGRGSHSRPRVTVWRPLTRPWQWEIKRPSTEQAPRTKGRIMDCWRVSPKRWAGLKWRKRQRRGGESNGVGGGVGCWQKGRKGFEFAKSIKSQLLVKCSEGAKAQEKPSA